MEQNVEVKISQGHRSVKLQCPPKPVKIVVAIKGCMKQIWKSRVRSSCIGGCAWWPWIEIKDHSWPQSKFPLCGLPCWNIVSKIYKLIMFLFLPHYSLRIAMPNLLIHLATEMIVRPLTLCQKITPPTRMEYYWNLESYLRSSSMPKRTNGSVVYPSQPSLLLTFPLPCDDDTKHNV